VFLVGPVAVKVPRRRFRALGMQCNAWEREMWLTWRRKFGWTNLCPIIFADRRGRVVVMRRARQPVSRADIDLALDTYPMITAETKPADWGVVSGRVVAVDYGVDEGLASEKRAYYASPQFER
jgi:hypothetical protein